MVLFIGGGVFISGVAAIGIAGVAAPILGKLYYDGRSDNFSDANMVSQPGARNALAHTYTSGDLTDKFGRGVAEASDDLSEAVSADRPPADTFKDRWNNELGRLMQEWCEKNGYEWGDVYQDLIMDAYNNGDLILTDARVNSTDPNSPFIDSRIDLSKQPIPDWNAPSENWRGAGQPVNPNEGYGKEFDDWLLDTFIDLGDDFFDWFNENVAKLFDKFKDIFKSFNGNLEKLIDNIFPSPIILDMDGDGVELFSLAESKTIFDMDNDNFVERTGWVKPDDALLVHDANNNGTIDNQAELFGDGGGFYDGFAKLDAQFDSNNDNLINASDTNFNKLRVWQDLNSNGISEAGELKTLAQVGITSISLADTYSSRVIAGHDVLKASTFVRNGQTCEVLDMVFDDTLFLYKNSIDRLAGMVKIAA
jgi:hypothetical protein